MTQYLVTIYRSDDYQPAVAAPVNREITAAQHTDLAAQLDKSDACFPDCWPIVFAEIGYGFVIWSEPPGQPHHFNITPGFTFQPST